MDGIRIAHVITGLHIGGAETALYRLMRSRGDFPARHRVVSLSGRGAYARKFESIGVPVVAMEFHANASLLFGLQRLSAACRFDGEAPDILHAWMYHGNFAALCVLPWLRPRPKLVWSIRSSLHRWSSFKFGTRQVIRAGKYFQSIPDVTIYNSKLARKQHVSFGYSNEQALLIPNGFDDAEFYFSLANQQSVRAELDIENTATVIGCVGRFHHGTKGNTSFVRMACMLAKLDSSLRFICVGRGMSLDNPAWEMLPEFKANKHIFRFLEERKDVSKLLSAFDVFVNPSVAESFPNVVCEAMLVELPCVVTDVGDSARILGSCGTVVEPADDGALVDAVMNYVRCTPDDRRRIGMAARERVINEFSAEKCSSEYHKLYQSVARRD